jgi:hypothetical protein
LGLGSIGISYRVVKTSVGIVSFAVGDVYVTIRLSIGKLSEGTDDDGVSCSHIGPFGFEISQELSSLLVDDNIIIDVGVIGIYELEVVLFLQDQQSV